MAIAARHGMSRAMDRPTVAISRAFMSVGAYTAANFAVRLGLPWPVNLLLGGLMAALVGAVVGVPSLRIKGLYLAIATLAGQLIIEWTINHVTFISGGVQASIQVPRPELFGVPIASQRQMYFLLLAFVVVALVGTMNLVRSRIGRAFIAIRDHDIAAEIIGIRPLPTKLLAFAISSFYCGIAGAELVFLFLGSAETAAFDITQSFLVLFMVIVGGLGSVLGSILGAAFIIVVPIFLTNVPHMLGIALSVALLKRISEASFSSWAYRMRPAQPGMWMLRNGQAKTWR